MLRNLIDLSKQTWMENEGIPPSVELISLGCLQRIAVTLESLNRSWCVIQEQNVRFRESIKTLEHKNRALRGQITKLKKVRT